LRIVGRALLAVRTMIRRIIHDGSQKQLFPLIGEINKPFLPLIYMRRQFLPLIALIHADQKIVLVVARS
jgi:hypothetical protein